MAHILKQISTYVNSLLIKQNVTKFTIFKQWCGSGSVKIFPPTLKFSNFYHYSLDPGSESNTRLNDCGYERLVDTSVVDTDPNAHWFGRPSSVSEVGMRIRIQIQEQGNLPVLRIGGSESGSVGSVCFWGLQDPNADTLFRGVDPDPQIHASD